MFRSADGGASWVATDLDALIFTLAVDPLVAGTVYAGGVGVFESTDSGSHWNTVNPALTRLIPVEALAVDGPSLYAATAGGGVFVLDRASPTPTLSATVPIPGKADGCSIGATRRPLPIRAVGWAMVVLILIRRFRRARG